jgi:hypothetical protein
MLGEKASVSKKRKYLFLINNLINVSNMFMNGFVEDRTGFLFSTNKKTQQTSIYVFF